VNWMERLNERADLMGRMLETIGAMNHLPTGVQSGTELRNAAYRCLNCGETETCRRWLQDHPDGADGPLPECPNAALFEAWLKS